MKETAEGKYRHRFHIKPPKGWLNDPNGTCYFNGQYHIFFQYSPNSPEGAGGRFWGHCVSKDLAHFTFVDTPIVTDTSWDSDGAYSGGAYTGDGILEIYYTGNVKHAGNYDYINEGRDHNVIRVDFADGIHPGPKQLILTNADYPSDLSCHVRDPKVFKEDDCFYMLLGMRSRSSKGGLLLLRSVDRLHWESAKEIYPEDDFGYMLECPDFFDIDGSTVVSFCPQGMKHETDRFQNTYESGYCLSDHKTDATDLYQIISIDGFREWDMGFDFYAPQTFKAPDGRRILIGWAGVPDSGYGNAPAIAEGWQHSLTLPREISVRNGILYTYPVKELEKRRERKVLGFGLVNKAAGEQNILGSELTGGAWDLEISTADIENGLILSLNDDLKLWKDKDRLTLGFTSDAGCGRSERRARLLNGRVESLRLIFDRSLLEIYVNHGEIVFTTRYYPSDPDRIMVFLRSVISAEGWGIV